MPHLLCLLGKPCLPQVPQLVGVLVCQGILNSACMQMYKDLASQKGVSICGPKNCLPDCKHLCHLRVTASRCSRQVLAVS